MIAISGGFRGLRGFVCPVIIMRAGGNVRLPGKGTPKSHGARPVHLIITMITSRLSINSSLSVLQVCRLTGHAGEVTSVAFSPDGTRVVSGSSDNLVKVWDAETGAEVSLSVRKYLLISFRESTPP